jgi:MSHA pilin protein MshC
LKRSGGFTMVELILVMIILGVLGAVILPRVSNAVDTEATGYADRIVAVLRLAQKSAVARRRVVCVTTSATAFSLRISSSNTAPPGACTIQLAGVADSDSATTDATVAAAGVFTPALAGGVLYFQPSGDITTDIGGATPASGTITVTASGAALRVITVEGATGYVDYPL